MTTSTPCCLINACDLDGHSAHCPRAPRIRHNADESAVCQHRDLTVCPDCLAALGDLAVDVYGAWYVCETAHAAAELRRVIGAPNLDDCPHGVITASCTQCAGTGLVDKDGPDGDAITVDCPACRA